MIDSLTKYLMKMMISCCVLCVIAASCSNPSRQRIDSQDAFNRGVRSVKAGNMDMASHYFTRAVILSPDFHEARLNLANVHFLQGRLEDARDEYSNLLENNVKDPRIDFNLGWIYLAQHDYNTAYSFFNRGIQNNDGFNDGHFGLALIARERGETVLAEFHLEKYLEYESVGRWSDRADNLLLQLKGGEVQTLNDLFHEESFLIEDSFDDEIDFEPTHGVDQPDTNEISPAEEDPMPVVIPQHEPESVAVEKSPKSEPQKSVKTESAKQEPSPEKPIQELIQDGFKALNDNDLIKAERLLKEVFNRDKGSIDSAFGLARIYYKTGKRSDMDKYTKQMIDRSGGDSSNSYELGSAYERIGDWKSAISHFSRYLKENPFGAYSEEAKERLTILDNTSN